MPEGYVDEVPAPSPWSREHDAVNAHPPATWPACAALPSTPSEPGVAGWSSTFLADLLVQPVNLTTAPC